MSALPPYLIEPIWEQFTALLPERKVNYPLGCHRSRVPDRVVFEKLVQVLVVGCAYWRIADKTCSATTLRRRRDEWIDAGLGELPEQMSVHLDRGYDSNSIREKLKVHGFMEMICEKGKPAPLQAGQRWVVERTNSWNNAHKKLV